MLQAADVGGYIYDRVIDFMGDAGGELTDGRHLLRLQQLIVSQYKFGMHLFPRNKAEAQYLPHIFGICIVGIRADIADHLPLVVPLRHRLPHLPADGTVWPLISVFHIKSLPLGYAAVPLRHDGGPDIGMDRLLQTPCINIIRWHSGHFPYAAVDINAVPFGIGAKNSNWANVGERREKNLAGLQGKLSFLPLGNIT